MLAEEKVNNVQYYTLDRLLIYNDGTNDTTYKLIGTSLNMSGYNYDMANDTLIKNSVVATRKVDDNILHAVQENVSVIYCKQNAYLFENIINNNEIIAVSINSTGKNIYAFKKTYSADGDFSGTENDNTKDFYKKDNNGKFTYVKYDTNLDAGEAKFKLEISSNPLGAISSMDLLYNGYGKDLSNNATIVDQFEYKAEVVFNNKVVIKTNDVYTMQVQPYKLSANSTAVINTQYKLYQAEDAGAINDDVDYLYDINTNNKDIVSGITFGRVDNCTILESAGEYYITFNSNANVDTINLPVTLHYKDGSTYTYYQPIVVANSTVVNINTAYNVDNASDEIKQTFNASIEEIAKSVDNYNKEDFGKWLNIDTTATNWIQNARFGYDMVLAGDSIDLATLDQMHNITCYGSKTYKRATSYDSGTTYYTYNSRINVFEAVEVRSSADLNTLIHFVQDTSKNYNISSIEMVAVSSSYSDIVGTVSSKVTMDGTTINVDPYFTDPGFVLFKVYAGNTGAYGYYALRIDANNQFNNVYGHPAPRKTGTEALKLINNTSLVDILSSAINQINIVAGISSDLINDDYSNVYLFMVNSNNVTFDSGKEYSAGEFVPNNTESVVAGNVIQEMEFAVVVQAENALVHICNYKIIAKPDIEVTPDTNKVDTINADLFEYTLKESEKLAYVYGGYNTIDLTSYFTSPSINEAIFDGGKPYSPWLSVEDGKISDRDKGTEIASISETTLTLNKSVSEETTFYVKLNGVISLRIILKPFEFESTTEFSVGEISNYFTLDNNVLKNYNITTDTIEITGLSSKVTKSTDNNTLTFTSALSAYTESVTVTLKDTYPNVISKTINITYTPNIKKDYTDGETPSDRVTTIKETTLSAVGSKLKVHIYDDGTNKLIQIQNDDGSILTITTQYFEKVGFTLTNDDGTYVEDCYFVKTDGKLAQYVELDDDGVLCFVHSALDKNLRLNAIVYANDTTDLLQYVKTEDVKQILGKTYYTYDAGTYTSVSDANIDWSKKDTYYERVGYAPYSLYLTLPNTYEVDAVYRTQGAKFETVRAGSTLTAGADAEASHDINDHLFGSSAPTYMQTKDSAYDSSKTYYTRSGASEPYTYTQATPTADDISKWTSDNERDSYYEMFVNEGRIRIKFNGVDYYGYDNADTVGLFTTGNPNKLTFEGSTSGANVLSVAGGELSFAGNDINNTINTLTITNSLGVQVEYNFMLTDAEHDLNNVAYNEQLTWIGDGNDTGKGNLDYISIPFSKFYDANDGTTPVVVELAYLKYIPNISAGYIADVVITGASDLQYEIVADNTGATNYSSKLVIGFGANDPTEQVFEITIITINGVSSTIEVVVANFATVYGYNQVGNGTESFYGGTEGYKLSDNYNSDYIRVRVAKFTKITNNIQAALNNKTAYEIKDGVYIKSKDTEPMANKQYYTAEEYTDTNLLYLGAVNGTISNLPLGTTYDATRFASYNNDKKTIGFSAVNTQKTITLIFDVKATIGGNNKVIGRIYYVVEINNNFNIGINPRLDENSVIDLYLGTNAYTNDGSNHTIIDLMRDKISRNGKELYNNLYVTLEQYSSGLVINNVTDKAFYNGTDHSAESIDKVTSYLTFSIDNCTGDLVKDGNIKIDEGYKLQITGNPSGQFDLYVQSKGVMDYAERFTIQVHKYDNTTANYSKQPNAGSGEGWKSGDEISLIKDIGNSRITDKTTTSNSYAFVTYREGYNLYADMNKQLLQVTSNTLIKYQIKTFNYNTNIETIKNTSDWGAPNDIHDKLETDGEIKIKLPTVKASVGDTKEYQIVAIRLTISYNDSSENYYYALYKVYNHEKLEVNEVYKNNQTLKFGDSAWSSEGYGDIVTIMDSEGNGMYSAFTTLENEPTDWVSEAFSGKYYEKNGSGYRMLQIANTDKKWDTTKSYYKITLLTGDTAPADWGDATGYYNNQWNSLPSETTYEPNKYYKIELINTEPADWNTKYYQYYIEDDGVYIPVGVLPFDSDKYYKLNTVANSIREEYTLLDEEPADWESSYENYFRYNDAEGKYEPVDDVSVPEFIGDAYYTRGAYTFWIEIDGVQKQITSISYNFDDANGVIKITGKLPNRLFDNEADMKFIVRSNETNGNIVEDDWHITAGTTIKNYDSMPLRNLFLQSEIGNQDLYWIDVIGVTGHLPANTGDIEFSDSWKTDGTETASDYVDFTKASQFVYGATVTKVTWKSVKPGLKSGTNGSSYDLYLVTFTAGGGNAVFKVEAQYYVLAGNTLSMTFNGNGGDYYINAPIDDTEILANSTTDAPKRTAITDGKATINIADYIQTWHFGTHSKYWKASDIEVYDSQVLYSDNWTALLYKDGDTYYNLKTKYPTATTAPNITEVKKAVGTIYWASTTGTNIDANMYEMIDDECYGYVNGLNGTHRLERIYKKSRFYNPASTVEVTSIVEAYQGSGLGIEYSPSDSIITLSNLNKVTSTAKLLMTVTSTEQSDNIADNHTVTREIELWITIPINLNRDKCNADGVLYTNAMLEEAMVGNDSLSGDDINNNTKLKKELLGLIEYNDEPVEISSNSIINRYTINVVKATETGRDYYYITYAYKYGAITYTRTLKMERVFHTIAKETSDPGNWDSNWQDLLYLKNGVYYNFATAYASNPGVSDAK
ncbi:MAG: hypothetical protein ACLRFE_01535 [Clostridia bacterium]